MPAIRKQSPVSSEILPEFLVKHLGRHGDGVAHYNGKNIFIDGALPDERVLARVEGERGYIHSILDPSPERIQPPCPVASSCGGCCLQHASETAERTWKQDLVAEALAKSGITKSVVDPVVSVPYGTRRRTTLSWKKAKSHFVMGYNARRTHYIVTTHTCMLLTKAISEASAVLREAIKDLVPSGKGAVSICDSDSGIDVVLDWVGRPDLQALEVLAALVHKHDWARLSLRIGTVIEPVAVQREPIVYMGEHPVRLPPGAFLQPSREGQEVLIDLVLKELKALSGPLLDLFCGLGTFSLPLAASLCRPVTAIDSDQKSVEYLAATGMVKALVRDLFRNPLLPSELENYEAIVLDPPRAGGAAQVLQIAQCAPKKGPKKIVMVSCNPFTCARDARTLTDAGFVIEKITPVNQFHRSMHVELVAVFSRV